MPQRNAEVIKKAKKIERRYGNTLRQDGQVPVEPILKARPKGTNPFRNRWGFKAVLRY